MYSHHKQALDRLGKLLQQDPANLALITTGSIAQGTAREDSDIDVYIVVKDEEFIKRSEDNIITYLNDSNQICDYPNGYIDGKIINLDFLYQAAEKGSEPTRNSFVGSEIWFSSIEGLASLLASIPVFPESMREQNIKDFQGQIMLYSFYFASEAVKKNNPYLLSHAVSNVVLFSGRLILSYNRILFPCHKSLMSALEKSPNKPDNYINLANELLAQPSLEKCQSFAALVLGFVQPSFTPEQATSIFIKNNEWNWLEQLPPLSDR